MQKKGKIKRTEIIYNVFYILLFWYVTFISIQGKPDDTSIELACGIFGVLCIVGAVIDALDQSKSSKDTVITVIVELVLTGIAFAKKGNIGNILIAIMFVVFALGRVFFTMGTISASFKNNFKSLVIYRIGRLSGLISMLTCAVYLLFISIGDGNFSFLPNVLLVTKILAIVGMGMVSIGTVVALIYYTPVKNINSNTNKSNSYSNSSEYSKDTRKNATFGFSSILYDRCYDIARHYSGTKDFGYGTVKIDVVVKINGARIDYVFNGDVSKVEVDQYSVGRFKDALTNQLQGISDLLVSDTDKAIDKLRSQYKDFDGQYSINVTQGEFKA